MYAKNPDGGHFRSTFLEKERFFLKLFKIKKLMPSEKELREKELSIENISNYIEYDGELLKSTNKNKDLELTPSEDEIKSLIDSEIEKMVFFLRNFQNNIVFTNKNKEESELSDNQIVGDSNILFFKGVNLISLSLMGVFFSILGMIGYGIYYLLSDKGKKNLKKQKKEKKKAH